MCSHPGLRDYQCIGRDYTRSLRTKGGTLTLSNVTFVEYSSVLQVCMLTEVCSMIIMQYQTLWPTIMSIVLVFLHTLWCQARLQCVPCLDEQAQKRWLVFAPSTSPRPYATKS